MSSRQRLNLFRSRTISSEVVNLVSVSMTYSIVNSPPCLPYNLSADEDINEYSFGEITYS
jgi:hypothetical protein